MNATAYYKYWQGRNMAMRMCQMRQYEADWSSLQWTLSDFTMQIQKPCMTTTSEGQEEEEEEAIERCFIETIGFTCFDAARQQQVLIVFFRHDATGKESVLELLEYCYKNGIKHVILILPAQLSHQANEVLENQDLLGSDGQVGDIIQPIEAMTGAMEDIVLNEEEQAMADFIEEEDEEQPGARRRTARGKKQKSRGKSNKKTKRTESKAKKKTVQAVETTTPDVRPIVEYELFDLASMQFDWIVNVSQPVVKIFTAEESAEFYTKYKLKPSQMPGVLINDPLCRWFHLSRGQLVKLTPRGMNHRPDYVVVGNNK